MRRPRREASDGEVSILEDVNNIFADPQAWLDTPNEHLDGRKPRDLLNTEEEKHLRALLQAIKHGIPT
jgi:uncharacterized protein (DUF2384 family)